ncbi:MurR/RpiR family transcriptional regulator [Vibrio sp. JPW-9-11-11]|uniref:MurR/RpiR family transcriptional regulator n=1 Tax=Vibrio sp. JPW-9-11-11 TaxID=1416532 RepID=UPI0015948487|nr:MurR/RpiR family transcriptional regulator [Vibrio sp. JPW-9-11-11]NVD05631.1 MurR/RpiR family transcriptional regulator [Vibrio sp. JPW-9-11-11]
MESIINKVKALAHSSNLNEQKISHFIIEQQFDLAKYSATKVGAKLGISDSSVIRYAKSIGCSGFPDLKLKLAALAPQAQKPSTQSVYAEIESSDSTQAIIDKSKNLFTSKIEQSLSLIDTDTIERSAELLLKANKILLSGIGASALVAADINHKLIRSGFNVQFNLDYHIQIVQASLLKKGDVLLVVSARGNTQEVLTAIEKARANGAKVIALTRYGKGKVAQLSDFVIPYSYTEEHNQLGMVTPQLLQMIAFDILFFKLNTLTDKVSMNTALDSLRHIQR